MRKILIGAVILLLGIAGLKVWQSNDAKEKAERQVALDSARVIALTFKDARTLLVRRGAGKVTAHASDDGLFGWVKTSQQTVAPFTVDYSLDLSKVTEANYRWSEKTNTLFVELPVIRIEPPNVDFAKAAATQDGVFVSRGAGMRLNKKAVGFMNTAATAEAEKPEQMELARQAAKRAVAGIAKAPLTAAGLKDVRVEPRFAYEGQRSDQNWDESTPLDMIFGKD